MAVVAAKEPPASPSLCPSVFSMLCSGGPRELFATTEDTEDTEGGRSQGGRDQWVSAESAEMSRHSGCRRIFRAPDPFELFPGRPGKGCFVRGEGISCPMLTRGLVKKGTSLERLRGKGGGRLQRRTRWNAGRVRARDLACPPPLSVCPLWFLRRPA